MASTLIPVLRRLPQYIYLADLFRGRRVVELGCGDGVGAHYLARAGAQTVIGLDQSAQHVDAARMRHRLQNLSFRSTDFTSLDLEDRSVDVICIPSLP
jgi:ubiquinone/menaquinone biosynthesis C-methylase UbiE